MGLVFLSCLVIAVVWSLAKPQAQPADIEASGTSFATTAGFNAAGLVVSCKLAFFVRLGGDAFCGYPLRQCCRTGPKQ